MRTHHRPIRFAAPLVLVAGDNEQYLADRLDQVHRAMRQGDVDDVLRQVGHVRGESDPQTADTLMRLALDRELKESRKKIRLWMALAIVLAVGAAITIAVLVPKTRLGTVVDTATTVTQTMVSTVPVPVATPAAPGSSVVPPAPAPDGSNFTVLHELTDITMGGPICGELNEGKLDIDNLEPDHRTASISTCTLQFKLDASGGRYIAKAPLTQPTAQECATQSKRGSQTWWDRDEVKAGEFAVCVTSKKGNVAWVKVVGVDVQGRMTLQVVVWAPGQR
ncbi:hypothetical protein SAMN05421507_105183 [Lentzea jiangxiensis]|uniref:Uncharacterized protein n=1 Tax=Lentzea jiangxiensis TaxID=641025 RepID=A0A1H0PSD5_9PSEU|nr:hypothetical protein SAMN05421507_105183 [Lentzea jiangxiensis]